MLFPPLCTRSDATVVLGRNTQKYVAPGEQSSAKFGVCTRSASIVWTMRHPTSKFQIIIQKIKV